MKEILEAELADTRARADMLHGERTRALAVIDFIEHLLKKLEAPDAQS